MSSVPPTDPSRRDQIRRYLQKFTTTIRRGSKDSGVENNIPQQSAETNDTQEHSHDDTLFINTIDAEGPSTAHDIPEEQSRPIPLVKTETFHIDRASVYQERVLKLRDRYGMNIAGSDRSTFPATAQRVQKTARMRIHRSCHECGIDFGHGIHCRACHHRLCGDCPRTPGRGIKEAMAQAREFPFHVVSEDSSTSPDLLMAEAPTVVSDQLDILDNNMASSSEHVSRLSTSLGPIITKHSFLPTLEVDDELPDCAPIRIVHNSRHGKGKQIEANSPRSSHHSKDSSLTYQNGLLTKGIVPYSISTIRDPILKAPAGVQRVYRKPRQRVRYTCHVCSTPFQSHGRTCGRCAHERCLECRDQPSRKSHKARPDPRLVEAVNQRLARVGK
jgi:hypothetical protein